MDCLVPIWNQQIKKDKMFQECIQGRIERVMWLSFCWIIHLKGLWNLQSSSLKNVTETVITNVYFLSLLPLPFDFIHFLGTVNLWVIRKKLKVWRLVWSYREWQFNDLLSLSQGSGMIGFWEPKVIRSPMVPRKMLSWGSAKDVCTR
jgi:hypothetical protein